MLTYCFDRNLSFETDEDDLAAFMSQFGDVVYCRVVIDPNTDHSKGISRYTLCPRSSRIFHKDLLLKVCNRHVTYIVEMHLVVAYDDGAVFLIETKTLKFVSFSLDM